MKAKQTLKWKLAENNNLLNLQKSQTLQKFAEKLQKNENYEESVGLPLQNNYENKIQS